MGALALFVSDRLVDVADMPVLCVRRGKSDKNEVDGWVLSALLREWAGDVGVIEQVGGIQGQAAGAAFNFGRAAGAVEYTFVTLGMRLVRVSPITWKKKLGIRGGKSDSVAAAKRLWPTFADRFSGPRGGDLDGRAEAGLIGHWYNLTNGASNDVFA